MMGPLTVGQNLVMYWMGDTGNGASMMGQIRLDASGALVDEVLPGTLPYVEPYRGNRGEVDVPMALLPC